ncbi:hypothetical protein BS78_05G041600 [Paspalum vaginatum]|nr:hypothetical protein BS78_05G041600 [Paspalum vaginatum]
MALCRKASTRNAVTLHRIESRYGVLHTNPARTLHRIESQGELLPPNFRRRSTGGHISCRRPRLLPGRCSAARTPRPPPLRPLAFLLFAIPNVDLRRWSGYWECFGRRGIGITGCAHCGSDKNPHESSENSISMSKTH